MVRTRADRAARGRVAYLDNLKALLVAAIIAAHGMLAYGDLESAWPYQDIQEVQLGAGSNAALAAVVIPAALFAMGLFFLVSGLVTPGALERSGPARFARHRLIRLGVPLLIWTLLLWPAAKWLSHEAAGDTESFWDEITNADPTLDTGPMWFVTVLLVYSLAYAGWCALRVRNPSGRPPRPQRPLTGGTLVVIAFGISIFTALVRPAFPLASGQILQAHLWQWPQFIAMFGLGIAAAQRTLLDPVPNRIRRRCGLTAIGGIAAWGLLEAAIATTGGDPEVVFDPGASWPALAMSLIEGPLAVGAAVWALGFAQLHLAERPGAFGRELERSAYAAFFLQGVVLIGLMVAFRGLDIPAEVKAIAVAALGVAGSFALAWLLVRRTPLGRVF